MTDGEGSRLLQTASKDRLEARLHPKAAPGEGGGEHSLSLGPLLGPCQSEPLLAARTGLLPRCIRHSPVQPREPLSQPASTTLQAPGPATPHCTRAPAPAPPPHPGKGSPA